MVLLLKVFTFYGELVLPEGTGLCCPITVGSPSENLKSLFFWMLFIMII